MMKVVSIVQNLSGRIKSRSTQYIVVPQSPAALGNILSDSDLVMLGKILGKRFNIGLCHGDSAVEETSDVHSSTF